MSKQDKAIKQTGKYGLIDNAKYGIRFGTQILLARLLTPNDFGTVALATATLAFISMLSVWGIDSAVMQADERTDSLLPTLFTVRFFFSAFFVLILGAILLFLRPHYSTETLYIIGLLGLGNVLTLNATVPRAVMQKEFQLFKRGLVDFTALVIASVSAIVLAFLDFGVWSLVLFHLINKVISGAGALLVAPFRPQFRFSKDELKWFYSLAKNFFLSGQLSRLITRGDDFMVGNIANSTTLGFYNMGWKVAKLFNSMVLPAINNAILPAFSSLEEESRISNSYQFVFRTVLRLNLIFTFSLLLLAPNILAFLFGEKWLGAVSTLRALAVYAIILPLYNINRHFFKAWGDSEIFLRCSIFVMIPFLLSLPPLILFWKGVGAALGLTFSFIFGLAYSYKKIGQRVDMLLLRNTSPILTSGIIAGFASFLFKFLVADMNDFLVILFVGLVMISVFTLVSLLFDRDKFSNDLERIRKAII